MTARIPRATRALLIALVAAAAIVSGGLSAPGDARPLAAWSSPSRTTVSSYRAARAGEATRRSNTPARSASHASASTCSGPTRCCPDQYSARNKPQSINYQFGQVDQLINRAAQNGIRVHLSLTGPAPRWANARRATTSKAWYKPNAREFGKWRQVVAEHFAGRVDRYSIWNEPNWKTWLGPLEGRSGSIYRSMYSRGYKAIKAADSRAKVLIGETSPYQRPGFSTAPLAFLRAVTCVDRKYRRTRSCPKLKADGYAHHPYDFAHAPSFQYPGRGQRDDRNAARG